ncbi:MAG: hypothetical protein MJ211_11970 [Bacteroidales bacterium]|nr:hypothetical protein [Bacteroidales bacterium]
MKRIYYWLILILLVSCSDSKLPKDIISHFTQSKNITANKVVDLERYNILKPWFVYIYNDYYVFEDDKNIDSVLTFLSFDLKNYSKGLRIGNGPNEVVGIFGIEVIDDTLYVKDSNHHRLLKVDYQDSLLFSEVSNSSKISMTSRGLNKNRYINVCSFTDSSFLSLVDTNDNIYSKLYFPFDENLQNENFFTKCCMYMNTQLAISPTKDKFAWSVSYFPSFGFGRINGDSLICDKSFEYYSAEYTNNNGRILCNKKSRIISNSSVGTDNYAVFLYCGNKYEDLDFNCNKLLLYTWNGDPYMILNLDYPLIYVNYDKSRNVFYGISEGEKTLLVEYDMNGIID